MAPFGRLRIKATTADIQTAFTARTEAVADMARLALKMLAIIMTATASRRGAMAPYTLQFTSIGLRRWLHSKEAAFGGVLLP